MKIGISEETFWKLNPTKLKPYIKAYNMRKEEERDLLNISAYVNGIYVRDALLFTVGNMFKGKNGKSFEFPKEPYEIWKSSEEPKELTEEEKIRQTEILFTRLNVAKDNWDLTH